MIDTYFQSFRCRYNIESRAKHFDRSYGRPDNKWFVRIRCDAEKRFPLSKGHFTICVGKYFRVDKYTISIEGSCRAVSKTYQP